MQVFPYVFNRDGKAIANLHADGKFETAHDGMGWFEYDSVTDFFDEVGQQMDPTNYVAQLAQIVAGVPVLNLQPPANPEPPPAPAPAPAPNQRRKRSKNGELDTPAPAPVAAPAPTPVPPPAPAAVNPLDDPAVQVFLNSQRAAAQKQAQADGTNSVQVTATTTETGSLHESALCVAHLRTAMEMSIDRYGYNETVNALYTVFMSQSRLLRGLALPRNADQFKRVADGLLAAMQQ